MRDFLRPYEHTTVAITGGYGYIGSALREALRQTSARIVLVSGRSREPIAGVLALQADIRTRECWTEIVPQADIVFHLAGNTSIHTAACDGAGSLNSTVLPLTHLVTAARNIRRRVRVVYASTATVYGLPQRLPVGEETDPRPVTTYDLHKVFAERQLELASCQGTLEGVSLRLTNVYGPSPGSSADDRGILNKIAARALGGSQIPVYGGGRYLRDYVYIDDVVRAFLAAGILPRPAGHAFNVGSGIATAVRDAFGLIVDQAKRATGATAHLCDVPWPEEPDPIESRNFVADIRRIEDAYGWKPMVSLPDGVRRLIDFLSMTPP